MCKVQTLLVVWQDTKSCSYYHIGTLSYYNNIYEFAYTAKSGKKKLGEALENGYMPHPAFPDLNKIYHSSELFPGFDRGIPSPNRRDYDAILADLGLNQQANRMDILRATRGRLASDTYSFENPLRIKNHNNLRACFFIHGMRHRNLPSNWHMQIKENHVLDLRQEPDNAYDSHAVAIYTKSGIQLGYIPTFYSNAAFSLIENGLSPIIRVDNINEKSHPHWWIRVEFECKIPSEQEKQMEQIMDYEAVYAI